MIARILRAWKRNPAQPTDIAQLERDLEDRLARRKAARSLPPIQRAAAIQLINREAGK